MNEQCKQWSMELESGGNIKFVSGDPSLSWYRTCTDLINSRFSVTNPVGVVSDIIMHVHLQLAIYIFVFCNVGS